MKALFKLFSIFATSHLHNVVNHRIYLSEINALGVVSLDSYNYVISGCDNLERTTSSFLRIFKFFTNVTPSRKFESGESQYPVVNVFFTKRRNLLTILSSRKLQLRRIFGVLQFYQTKIYENFITKTKNQYHSWNYQKNRIFRSCRNFSRRFQKTLQENLFNRYFERLEL